MIDINSQNIVEHLRYMHEMAADSCDPQFNRAIKVAADEIERMRTILKGIAGWKYHRLFADAPWEMSDMGNAYSCGSQAAFEQCASLAEGALGVKSPETIG